MNNTIDILGPNHPDIANSYSSLGALFDKIKDYDKAIYFLNNAL